MIKNYFKTAWRNLVKSKGYSAINIGGLAIGMAVAMLIGLWMYDELTFNKYHQHYNRIAQVMQHGNFNGEWDSQTANPALMGPEIKAKYGSDFKYVVQSSWSGSHLLSVDNKPFNRDGIFFEPDAPEMLTLNMLKGTRAGLKDPYSIMLSASTAEAIFGKDDPVNKIIKLDRNMASFVAEQRTKEIGIRKVLGASVMNLWRLLSTEFVVLVLLSCVIAVPIAWYYLHEWLANYDYRISISWTVFVLAAAVALIITLATVSFQAIKAAMANPVKSLRTE